MKHSFESGYAKQKKAKEQEKIIKKLRKLTFSVKLLLMQLPHPPVLRRLVCSIAEEKEEQSNYADKCSETAVTSVNLTGQSQNTTSSGPCCGLLQINLAILLV
jgi:uncharacterized protein (DUF1919 family)